MNIEDYEDISDGIGVKKLNAIYDIFFDEVKREEDKKITIEKLEILSEKQWHTYELPSKFVQKKIREWLVSNWDDTDEYLESAMVISYSFGLDKNLYKKALSYYTGECPDDFLKDIENSPGDFIDPYWSMKKTTKT